MADGLEVRIEADQETGQVLAVTLVLDDGALQLQPFAAPRHEGIWDEVRAEIRTGITRDGGTSDEVEGPLGTELRTKVPVRAQDGKSGVEPARFLGVDGPRWFLRGVLTGRPAAQPGRRRRRCSSCSATSSWSAAPARWRPREPIPLRCPTAHDARRGAHDEVARASDHARARSTRGPEITEIH